MIRVRMGYCCGILGMCLLLFLCAGFAVAERFSVNPVGYVLPENSDYNFSGASPVTKFFYGSSCVGKFYIEGTIEKQTTYKDIIAFGATGALSIHYDYTGTFRSTPEEEWHLVGDDIKKFRGYDAGLFQNMAKGCIMIESSPDGKKWQKVIEPIRDYFASNKISAQSLILKIPEIDYRNGMYYRVVVAYKFARRVKDGFLWNDEYENKKCVETYEFYVASEKNDITIRDLWNRSTLKNKASTSNGFMICKNGSQGSVFVNDKECGDFDYFAEPGEYHIRIVTRLKKQYDVYITVIKGITLSPALQTKTYVSKKDNGFPLMTQVQKPVFGTQLTSLSLAVQNGCAINRRGNDYGITGSMVSLYLKLNQNGNSLGNGWKLSDDSWGKNKNQLVCGVETGQVGRGALIIQTSSNGMNWRNVDKGRYEKGLYTTDYASHYGINENVLIYKPSGQDVINGVHIRVFFAYQVFLESKREYRDYVEMYLFYLCSDELGAVTFHNLSVNKTVEEMTANADQATATVYKQAESLNDGDYTVTGFQIDKKQNPTVGHTVILNGKDLGKSISKFDKTGKYDIILTSAVGSTRKLSLYVDRMTPLEAMALYFGDGFLSGKRIFSEEEYPVYEGGKLAYYVARVDDNVLPLYGQITNLATGSVITVEQNRDEKVGIISEPGMYKAVFSTSEKVFTGQLTGDARVFTFNFSVIPQGTAPGPVINKRLLEEYAHSTMTDCNPVYYGLTYSSAAGGNITLAFATKEAAVEYAYNYEKGTVEQMEDGGYRYNGSFDVKKKVKYNSAWDLTDAVNSFAEEAVNKSYFDFSDESTYLTLPQEAIDRHSNLRKLELSRSVTIFANGQKEQLTDIDALPLLNDKSYAYIDPESGEITRGVNSFQFVTDQYGGIDSKTISITDSEGGQHSIQYSESVGQQLLKDNCPSGIVTIREETMYGDFAEYTALYIAPDDNRTGMTLVYSQDYAYKTVVYTKADHDTHIVADAFRIAELNDTLDPYAFVIVKHELEEEAFTAKESIDKKWSEPGNYSITCMNRMGYGFTVHVTVEKPKTSSAAALTTVRLGNDDATENPTRSGS